MLPKYLYGIVGHPLGHSLSPQLHSWGFAQVQHPGAYFSWPVPPESLADMLHAMRLLPIHGMSVTIPHKQPMLTLTDVVTQRAQRVGAVNTLYWQGDAICGDNTDIIGFMAPLMMRRGSIKSALVLGAGGAARAVLAGLRELEVPHITISARQFDKAELLGACFGAGVVLWDKRTEHLPDLLINATPLGLHGSFVDQTPWPAEAFKGRGIAYDLVYNPLETRFLREAKAAGWQTHDGLDMFITQGLEQFRLWTGHVLDPDQVRAMLLQYL